MNVAFLTLGCKVNQYETEVLKESFLSHGFTSTETSADIVVVNSCTVTTAADKKTRQLIHKIRRENPTAVLALTGCLPQSGTDITPLLAQIDVVTGANNRADLVHCVLEHLKTGLPIVHITPHTTAQAFEPMSVAGFTGHRRAFIKIQDGCNRFCSYCIIPTARGPLRSKPVDEIAAEAKKLVENGFKEIVLVGINLAMYGVDLGLTLPDGVLAASGAQGVYRVRLGSVEPDLLTDTVLQRLYENKRLCAHFHIPLQSGCDSTLKRMNRRYTTEEYAAVLGKIRKIFGENTAISTDIIVGFPDETEQEFAQTQDFVQSLHLSNAHIFEFSPRVGTAAYSMQGVVAPQIKSQRSEILMKLIRSSSEQFAYKQKGSVCEVLVENSGNKGYNAFYTYVHLPTETNLAGQLVKVLINSQQGNQCTGTIL